MEVVRSRIRFPFIGFGTLAWLYVLKATAT